MNKPINNRQLFTTDVSGDESKPFPMDHFYIAPYIWDEANKRIVDQPENSIVSLERVAGKIIVGYNYKRLEDGDVVGDSEKFTSLSAAFRKMADILEKHEKGARTKGFASR